MANNSNFSAQKQSIADHVSSLLINYSEGEIYTTSFIIKMCRDVFDDMSNLDNIVDCFCNWRVYIHFNSPIICSLADKIYFRTIDGVVIIADGENGIRLERELFNDENEDSDRDKLYSYTLDENVNFFDDHIEVPIDPKVLCLDI